MAVSFDNSLVEAARRIAPVIRAHNQEAEINRRLSRAALDALTEAGLMRLFTPRSLGGLETDPVTLARVVEEVSGSDSAAGWTLFNPLSYVFLAARLPEAGVQEIFGKGPDTLIAGPFYPPLRAAAVEGGYHITGRNALASNCHDADWMVVTAVVMDGDQPRLAASGGPEMVMAYLSIDACEIIDTWHVMGMKGTGSNDISFTDAFVPATRTFPWVPEFQPGSHFQGPLYRYPFVGMVMASVPPVMLAMARNAIDEVSALAQGKVPFASATALRERATTQSKLAQAEAALRSSRVFLYETLGEAWSATIAGNTSTLEQKADLLLAGANAASSAVRAVELMYSVAGTSGIYTRNPLERHFRDIQVLKHHGFVVESRFETVGQVYFGLPPDLAVVAF